MTTMISINMNNTTMIINITMIYSDTLKSLSKIYGNCTEKKDEAVDLGSCPTFDWRNPY